MKLQIITMTVLALSLAACSKDDGKKNNGPRACNESELAGFNRITSASNSQMPAACDAYFAQNKDMSSCVATAQKTMETQSGTVHAGDTVSLDPKKLKTACDSISASSGSGSTSGSGSASGSSGATTQSCDSKFMDVVLDITQNQSAEACRTFRRSYSSDYKCQLISDAGTTEVTGVQVYNYCSSRGL